MQKVIRFLCDDGTEWASREEALRHDSLIEQINVAMLPLAILDAKIKAGIETGRGWYQHDLETVYACREAILQICRERGLVKSYPVFNHHGRDVHPCSGVGRILGDIGGPLKDAWHRFMCIDSQGREHQQCYFAYTAGPEKNHVCLNPAPAAAA